MKTRHLLQTAIIALTLVFSPSPSDWLNAASLGTAFTYQGRLSSGGNAANGSYDLKFSLYDDATSGSQVGSSLTNAATGVSNGLFTVALDFGAIFDGNARWLEIGIRTNGAGVDFTPLTPRQSLTPAPYASWADSAASAQSAEVAKDLASPLTSEKLAGTYTGKLTLFNETNEFYGECYGDGYGITHLNASQMWYGTMPDGRLSTNVALLPANQLFSGTNYFSGVLIATNPASQLPVNVALLPAHQSFSGTNYFAGVLVATNPANQLVGAGGGGGSITGVQAGLGLVGGGTNGVVTLEVDSTYVALQSHLWMLHEEMLYLLEGYSPLVHMHLGGDLVEDTVYSSVLASDSTSLAKVSGGVMGVSAGKVGIGTNNPQSTLHVAGLVTATEFSGSGAGLTGVSAESITGGLTTNLAFLTPGGFTNTLCFTNGILRAIR
jgi:hypothetical protein